MGRTGVETNSDVRAQVGGKDEVLLEEMIGSMYWEVRSKK
jgi:hypothetical protein